jgi:cathepsin F
MSRLLLLAVLLAAATAVTPRTEASLEADFAAFVTRFNKVYDDEERVHRFDVFRANMARVDWQNSFNTTATYGVTKFSDITPEEFRERYLSQIPAHLSDRSRVADVNSTDIPTEWDWRTLGAVTEVKNQGQCGSCWSFSTTGNVEGIHFLANKGNKLIGLSEQQLVDCDKVDQGCDGGLPSNAYQYIISAGGIEAESFYPYTAEDGNCDFIKSDIVVKISNWTAVPTDETKIAAFLVETGPLSIGINAEWMQTYTSGVSDPWFCDPTSLDHGVLIVGYGVQSQWDGEVPFWIIKNSWGADWGESGYYRIIRGKGKCGLNTMVTSAIA